MQNITFIRNWIILQIALAGTALATTPAVAQETAQNIIPRLPPRPELEPRPPEELPSPEELLERPLPTPPQPQIEPGLSTIIVSGFEIVGNTAFSEAELQKVLEKFANRPITFAELLQVEAVITQLYIDNGYLNSGASISPQTLETGTVTVRITEGSLAQINVTVDGRLNPGYVRSRLAIGGRDPLNVNHLQEALQLLQIDPLIENIRAELSQGTRRELWTLDVEVKVAPAFEPQIIADNSRNPSVGSFQREAQLYHGNLLGLGDKISIAYNNTDGSDGYEGSYSLPINGRNGTIDFLYRSVDSDIIEPPFSDLDIKSNSRSYELTYRQPVVRRARVGSGSIRELALGLSATRRESDTTLLGERFPLSLGANSRGETRISAVRFFQEWTQRTSREVLAARSQFSLGVGALDATINKDEPDSRFFAWRGQGLWLRQLGPDANLVLRSDIQLATIDLVPLEQFGLGGIRSVRGYRQDALLADNGVFASAELFLPVWRVPQKDMVLSFIPFVDVGTVWNSGRKNPDDTTLLSLGVGLQWQIAEKLRVRLDWGIPLIDINQNQRERTWQENGLYFSIELNPFSNR
ncbi:MAG: ShlB/FhaC/HecB family hemolysin secretion/activation protein [Hormoscilla sp.]